MILRPLHHRLLHHFAIFLNYSALGGPARTRRHRNLSVCPWPYWRPRVLNRELAQIFSLFVSWFDQAWFDEN
jgi:hypothetical protein